MRLQVLSDLHLESEMFEPEPAADADVLVLAGDIDSTWAGFERFRGWPVPVIVIAGNHEFDRREVTTAWPALRAHCERLGLRLIECETLVLTDREGRRVRFAGTVRWSDFDLFGPARRDAVMRAATYFTKVMRATRSGEPFDAPAVRDEALACRSWLQGALRQSGAWDATVVVTHYAPSLRSADPRYGAQPGTASFCNDDEALMGGADLWIHGHLHCRHDYRVEHASGSTRVVSNARGVAVKGEVEGHRPDRLFEI